MKKQKNTKKPNWKKIIYISIGAFTGLILIGIVAVYCWPLRDSALQTVTSESLSYSQALSKVGSLRKDETSRGVTSNCQSRLLVHEQKTAKSVVMFHGVSACSYQFSDLAQYFYERGYNVYAPTALEHGTSDEKAYSQVSSKQLVDFANQSANITSALGSETGVIGLSGGGMLATWTAQYHENMKHLLVLSPFFEPSRQQAAAYKIKPFLLFYGKHIIPDTFSVNDDGSTGLSYYALTQFAIVGKNLPSPAAKTNIQSVSLVLVEDDIDINQPLARSTISEIADTNNLKLRSYDIPAAWGIAHVTVGPENEKIDPYRAELYQRYFDMYSDN